MRAANPPQVTLTLALAEERTYRVGEYIEGLVTLDDGLPIGAARKDAMWVYGGFLLDPPAWCGSADGYPCAGSARSGPRGVGSSGPGHIEDSEVGSGASKNLRADLTEIFPPLPPGTYHIAVLFNKHVRRSGEAYGNVYGYAEPPERAISNTLTLHIVPADEDWIRDTVLKAATALSELKGISTQDYLRRRRAAREIANIDHPVAWRSALELIVMEESTFLQGFSRSDQPAALCALMQERLALPKQSVSRYYLHSLSGICTRAVMPLPPPLKLRKPGEEQQPLTPEQLNDMRQRSEHEAAITSEAAVKLAAALSAKAPTQRAAGLETLLLYLGELHRQHEGKPTPPWSAALPGEFAAIAPELEQGRLPHVLSLAVQVLPTPDLIPICELLMDRWKPGDYYEVPRMTIRNLYALDRATAQTRIVQELRKGKSWLDAADLDLLPADKAPFSDDELIQALAVAQEPDHGWNVRLRMAAIAKYASPGAHRRIRAIYESQEDTCQPILAAYFVRADAAYATLLFGQGPWDMRAEPSRCMRRTFEETPRLAMSPLLEKYLAAHLMHRDVPLKMAAAKALGSHGSRAAEGPLWEALSFFHRYWKGRAKELNGNHEGLRLEADLADALIQAKNWVLREADLHLMESLCISDGCSRKAREALNAWRKLEIQLPAVRWQDYVGAKLGPYYRIDSREAFLAKLAQFPEGTRFYLTHSTMQASYLLPQIRGIAQRRTFTLVPPLPIP